MHIDNYATAINTYCICLKRSFKCEIAAGFQLLLNLSKEIKQWPYKQQQKQQQQQLNLVYLAGPSATETSQVVLQPRFV